MKFSSLFGRMESAEVAKGIVIPIIADLVLSPEVFYGDELTGIYFKTEEDLHGRITFENLDSLKICRGETLPYEDDWIVGERPCWVFRVENSLWQQERYTYEKKIYGSSYEFGGSVDEMMTDFGHFVFRFHDEFVEAIARGFWFEQDARSLFKRELQEGHPLLDLPEIDAESYVAHTLECQVRRNPIAKEELISNAKFCSQKLMQFALVLDGRVSVSNTLLLSYRDGKLISSLRGYFGKQIAEFNGIATFSDVEPYIENYMKEVLERRKQMGLGHAN